MSQAGPERRFSLSELVARSGVPASTIHHYRRAGMIPPPVRETANRFGYDERHLEALRRIRAQAAADPPECRARVVAAAIEAFQTRSYSEVTVSDIAEAAQMAQGHGVPALRLQGGPAHRGHRDAPGRHRVALRAAVTALGGPTGLTDDPEKTAMVFGHLVAGVLPMLLELGARAAKGHEPSADLARQVLRTLAEAGGPSLHRPERRHRGRHPGRAVGHRVGVRHRAGLGRGPRLAPRRRARGADFERPPADAARARDP